MEKNVESVKIALLGCGTVGSQVARLLHEENDVLSARAGIKLDLIGIAVNNLEAERDPWISRELLTSDASGLIQRADIVIELIGGIEPPRTLVHEALTSGASVVTGNKALLAAYGPEIYDLAAHNDVDVYYEAAVAGAVPVVYGLRESLAGDRVETIQGILNGTTNFILDEMTTKGMSFEEALTLAQDLGYAEADPTADVDGLDAAAKIAILASLAFHTRVYQKDVTIEGIREITADDILAAHHAGYVIKLIATATRQETSRGPGVDVRVNPALVPMSHPLAAVNGSFNAVVIEGRSAGRLMFYGRGAGGAPTASAVLSDVVAAAAKKVVGGRAPQEVLYGHMPLIPVEDSVSKYQITLAVTDKVGVLAGITNLFAESGVSVSAIQQRAAEAQPGQEPKVYAFLTITTHAARHADVTQTVNAMANVEGVQEVVKVLRVEDN